MTAVARSRASACGSKKVLRRHTWVADIPVLLLPRVSGRPRRRLLRRRVLTRGAKPCQAGADQRWRVPSEAVRRRRILTLTPCERRHSPIELRLDAAAHSEAVVPPRRRRLAPDRVGGLADHSRRRRAR